MKILSRLFSKSPEDFLATGDRFFESGRFFDARNSYEDGLQRTTDNESDTNIRATLKVQIENANLKLAELNLAEAEFAFSRGDTAKAVDHIELVKTLTYDKSIREKAEEIFISCTTSPESTKIESSSSCSSCSKIQTDYDADNHFLDDYIHPLEYFELLIRQLPDELYQRYSGLGEDFAYGYVAACQDKHQEALALFDNWSSGSDSDVYYCERGKVLHRIGSHSEAEQHLNDAIRINRNNSLAWLNLAMLFIDAARLDEAMYVLNTMISENMMREQAMLMRGEILEAAGNLQDSVDQYSALLTTPLMRSAAEKLYGLLIRMDRNTDAQLVFKKFLGKCSH